MIRQFCRALRDSAPLACGADKAIDSARACIRVGGWGLVVGGWRLVVGGWRLAVDGYDSFQASGCNDSIRPLSIRPIRSTRCWITLRSAVVQNASRIANSS